MSGYLIFVLILTIGYIIYYTVVICQDLRNKKGQDSSENKEEFALENEKGENSYEEDTPIEVVENSNGFSVGGTVYEQPNEDNNQPQPAEDSNSGKKEKINESLNEIINNSEIAEVKQEKSYNSDSLIKLLKEKTGSEALVKSGIKALRLSY